MLRNRVRLPKVRTGRSRKDASSLFVRLKSSIAYLIAWNRVLQDWKLA